MREVEECEGEGDEGRRKGRGVGSLGVGSPFQPITPKANDCNRCRCVSQGM